MTSYHCEIIPTPICVIGEGPHWDIETESLYFVNIYGSNSTIHRYDYAENQTYGATIDGEPIITFMIPVEGTTDQFAIGIGQRVGVINWDGKSPKGKLLRIAFEVEQKMYQFNDAKADSCGRFYGGTMRLAEIGNIFYGTDGSLYKTAKGEEVIKLSGNLCLSNGLTWNKTTQKFYLVDSGQTIVKEFDHDSKTGNISNERILIDFKKYGKVPELFPDGMTIDADGFLYVAIWGGSKVLKINPNTGKVELEIKLPAEQITSVAFGGPNLDILYVTSASTEGFRPQSAPAGSMFKVTGLGVKGLPMNKVRL